MKRTRTDEELKEILESYDENELKGLNFGLLPSEKTPEDLSKHDVVKLIEMNPEID